jgi:hypothetical protein
VQQPSQVDAERSRSEVICWKSGLCVMAPKLAGTNPYFHSNGR